MAEPGARDHEPFEPVRLVGPVGIVKKCSDQASVRTCVMGDDLDTGEPHIVILTVNGNGLAPERGSVELDPAQVCDTECTELEGLERLSRDRVGLGDLTRGVDLAVHDDERTHPLGFGRHGDAHGVQ